MVSIRSGRFTARLKRLSRTAFTDLIVSIWRARGYDIKQDGPILVVSNDAEKRTVWIHHTTHRLRNDPTPPDRPIDLVVTNRTGPPEPLPQGSPRIVDADDLEGMLFYAIDRDTAEAVADRVFDVSELDELRVTARERERSRLGVVSSGVVVTLVLGVIVFTGLIVLPGTLSGDISVETVASAALGPATERATPEADRMETTTDTTAQNETGETKPIRDTTHAAYFLEYGDPLTAESDRKAGIQADFPMGLIASGIENANTIAQAHARHIDNRSYRVEIEYQEFRDGEVESTYVERINVESPSRYASTIEQSGTRMFDPPVVTRTAVFADGQTVTTKDGVNYSVATAPDSSTGYYTERISTYLRWYLSVEKSAIVDVEYQGNQTEYIVRLGPDPWPDRVNSSGYARITDQGMVQYLRVKYRIPDTETTAEVTIRYVAIGDIEVSPPAWYTKNTTRTPTPTSG